jgi:hypothetical protein
MVRPRPGIEWKWNYILDFFVICGTSNHSTQRFGQHFPNERRSGHQDNYDQSAPALRYPGWRRSGWRAERKGGGSGGSVLTILRESTAFGTHTYLFQLSSFLSLSTLTILWFTPLISLYWVFRCMVTLCTIAQKLCSFQSLHFVGDHKNGHLHCIELNLSHPTPIASLDPYCSMHH